MTSASRALRALAPLLLLAPLPLAAQQAATAPVRGRVAAGRRRRATRKPDDPWIYRGTDIPVDQRVAVRRDAQRAALRGAQQPRAAGAGVDPRAHRRRLAPRDRTRELGFAHLIEHLTFRESKYLGDGEAIPHFQRLGASLGNDTNAITSPTQTVYKLDLPNARDATLEESIKLLSGMIREPALSEANLAAEVPIVLAERRERNGPDQPRRRGDQRSVLRRPAARRPLADRHRRDAAGARRRARSRRSIDRWYRPENTVIVIAGDADPQRLAALVEKYFGDWQVPRPADAAARLRRCRTAPRGADPANPVGETRVIVEPGQPRQLSYAVLRPWQQVTDNIEYNRGLLIDAVAETIINRRLETRAREGGSFLFASVGQPEDQPLGGRHFRRRHPARRRLEDGARRRARGDRRRARHAADAGRDRPRGGASSTSSSPTRSSSAAIQAGSTLADDVVGAVDIRESVAAPETILDVFRGMKSRFTPEEIHAAHQAMFTGTVVRAVLLTPEAGEADAAGLRRRCSPRSTATARVRARPRRSSSPTCRRSARRRRRSRARRSASSRGRRRAARLRQRRARADLADRERARPRDRAGALRQRAAGVHRRRGGLHPARPGGAGQLGRSARSARTSSTASRPGARWAFDSASRTARSCSRALTRGERRGRPDLPVRRQARRCRGGTPRPIERAKATLLLAYDSLRRRPQRRDQPRPRLAAARPRSALRHAHARRSSTPTTPEGFRKVWSRLLAQGPVEVDVFGDIDRETVGRRAVAHVRRAAARAEPAPPAMLARRTSLPGRRPARRSCSTIAASRTRPRRSSPGRRARARPACRRAASSTCSRRSSPTACSTRCARSAGASYSPYVGSNWPLDTRQRRQHPRAGAAAARAGAGVLRRGREDRRRSRRHRPDRRRARARDRADAPAAQPARRPGTAFWLQQLEGAAFDRNRVAYLPYADERLHRRSRPRRCRRSPRAISARGAAGGWRCCRRPAPRAAAAEVPARLAMKR